MNLTKSLFLIPAATSLIVAAIASGACGTSVTVTAPPSDTPPTDFVADGWAPGQTCSGDVYVGSASGYLYCGSAGVWVYTTSDPASDGYSSDDTTGSDTESVTTSEEGDAGSSSEDVDGGSDTSSDSSSEDVDAGTDTSSDDTSSSS